MSTLLKQVIADCEKLEAGDPVNSPAHYVRGGVECIDAIAASVQDLNGLEGYYTGNAMKYLFRWKEKNGLEDLRKAEWYIRELIAYVESERTPDGTKDY